MTLTRLNTLLATHNIDLIDIKILEAIISGCKTLDAISTFAGRGNKRQWCLNRINALKEKGLIKNNTWNKSDTRKHKRLVSLRGKKIIQEISESV